MNNKNKTLAILIFLFIMLVIAHSLGPVFTAPDKKVIDKGIANHKNYNDVKIKWTATLYKDNKLEVNRYFYKNKTIFKIKKTTFERIDNGNVKVVLVEKNNNTTTNTTYRYMKINENSSLKSYYFNVHRPKIIENIVKSEIFDSGQSTPLNIAQGNMYWNAKIYYNNNVLIEEEVPGNFGYDKKTFIEKEGKGKLKITTQYTNNINYPDSEINNYFSDSKTIYYVDYNSSPKNYYLNVYKPNMTENSFDYQFNIEDFISYFQSSAI